MTAKSGLNFTASSISVKVPFKPNLFLFKDLDVKALISTLEYRS